ncbi:NAD(+) diphosphatase [Arthrobacter sp. PsM3]|uniref:NAD(+) diphosphatase n=1 Tax=Arthrobacter sp. PsM3 TaxID=3030531 RepID=UPI00263B113B|nr:NAD(+) diphosphatase [Arthrobacter sp. PsM3]MDN4645827.1 NAD(+) diphosphatase [Arthrobacter sp. PsM3]
MSLAESPASKSHAQQSQTSTSQTSTSQAPDSQARHGRTTAPHPGLTANLITDTVLPVRSALIDRGSAARLRPGMLGELMTPGGARAMVLSGRQALINGAGLVLLDAAELARHLQDTAYAPDQLIYLGTALPGSDLAAGTPLILFLLPQQFEVRAEEFEAHIAGIPEAAQWAGFRDVAATLNPTDTAIFVEASAIANWHATHTHCPRCGTATEPEAGGWVRRCPSDGSEHYPRTDPAIIVTVVGPDGRLLLGGGGPLDARNYSTLAGFVEPGESLEQAVVREIGEEVGVRVTACQYLGSQSWPFPASLMLGFTATTADTEATPDGIEVTRARWFSRSELQEAVLSGEIVISSRLSIARALIEHWYGGTIQDRPDSA